MLSKTIKMAKEAGKVMLHYSQKVNKVQHKKTKYDVFSKADLETEKTITNLIKKEFPTHSILSEEKGFVDNSSDYCWVVDPIDGTANYIAGFPFFATSIALAYKNEPIIGVVYDPVNNELTYAEKNKGAYLNEKSIKISKSRRLPYSMVGTDLGYGGREETIDSLIGLSHPPKHFRICGSASKGIVSVALDRLQAYFHTYIKPWDMAAAILIVKEAGGEVTNFKNEKIKLEDKTLIASNGQIHEELVEFFKRKEKREG
jgi:myo-inositol-1(or 4)-monophosphatase